MSLDFQCGKNYKKKSESDEFVASQILTDSSFQKYQKMRDLQKDKNRSKRVQLDSRTFQEINTFRTNQGWN